MARLKCLVTAAVAISLAIPAVAIPQVPSAYPNKDAEYAAKADMMKSLIDMISWPAKIRARKNLVICIPEDFPYIDKFNTLNGKIAANLTLKVEAITDPLTTTTQCQMMLITDRSQSDLSKIIALYKNKPVVLVGDMDRFALQGGSMNYVYLNKVLAITVNTDVMRSSDLPINLKSVEQITVVPQVDDLKSLGD